MKRLYAPWRSKYVTEAGKKENSHTILQKDCVFCQQIQANDDHAGLILRRFDLCFVIMNRYPYNGGHVMVLPYDHKGELEDLAPATRAELMEVVTITKRVLQNVLMPHGFNIGINVGVAGGGGIPAHLHIHLVPRWKGDTSFLETVGEVKLVSSDMEEVYQSLKNGFDILLGKI